MGLYLNCHSLTISDTFVAPLLFPFFCRFIEFGRGKVIPLTPPENSKADLAAEISNIGRIIVDKCIEKIEKVDTNASLLFGPYDILGAAGSSSTGHHSPKMMMVRQSSQQQQLPPGMGHKKKRLYSLGGNEPIRIHRGRLNRLKTVGTFDLTIEEVPRGNTATEDESVAGEKGNTNNSAIPSATSTANSTSTEIFTASSNANSSSSCLNSPKELQQLRKLNHRKGGNSKLLRQVECTGTSSESFEKVATPARGGLGIRGKGRSGSGMTSSLEAKGTTTTDDEDPVTIIKGALAREGTGTGTTDSEEMKSPDEVFTKTKSILSNSSEFKARKSTFKKSKRIQRTDSELIHDDESYEEEEGRRHVKYSTDSNDSVLSQRTDPEDIPPQLSSSVVSSSAVDDDEDDQDEQADRFSLGTNLQREYKSDGNSLDEIGLQRDSAEEKKKKWLNQSLDLMSTTSMDCIPPKRDSDVVVVAERGKSETPPSSLSSGKLFKKINKVWKCKKFSMSSGNVRRKEATAMSPGTPNEGDLVLSSKGGEVQEIISPSSVVSDSPKVTLSSSSIFSKIRQQAMTATSSPSSSVASSRSHPRRLFSRLTSISNTELYKTGGTMRGGTRTQCKDISKSNSEINATASPFRKNTMRQQQQQQQQTHSRKQSLKTLKLEKMKNNSAGCLAERKMAITEPEGVHNVSKMQSPLSEEFYNKTGSVRLSAVELFEKFCSADFSGLYKHELDPVMVQAGAGSSVATKRYIYRKNSKLLKQRSEPRFMLSTAPASSSGQYSNQQQQFRFDDDIILSEAYYEEEYGEYDEKEGMEELGEEEYYEDEYDDEEEGVAEEEEEFAVEEEEQERLEADHPQNNEYLEEGDQVSRPSRYHNLIGRLTEEDDEEAAEDETNNTGAPAENLFIFEHSNDDNQEVDEIILMPETIAYPTKRVHLHRTEVIYDLNNLDSTENITAGNNALLLSVIKDYVRNSGAAGEAEIALMDNCRDFEVKSVNNEDILTIYRICSEENLTLGAKAHMSSSKSDTQFVQSSSNRRGFIKTPQSSYKRPRKHSQASSTRSGPTPLVTVEFEEGGGDLDEEHRYGGRRGSDCSDLDMEEDTVRFLCPDSFGSRLSLSLFDDLSLNFSLTLNDNEGKDKGSGGGGMKLLAPDCDADDFNLTSEGSVSECVDSNFRIVESLPSDGTSENNSANDEKAAGGGSFKGDEGAAKVEDYEKEKTDPEKETPIREAVAALIENFMEGQSSFSLLDDDSIGLVDEDEEPEEEEEEELDGKKVSRFTNHLQKEFDMLFDIAATKPNVEIEVSEEIQAHSANNSMRMHKSSSGHSHNHQSQQQQHGNANSLIASIRTRISSRHSMQNLEPYEPMELNNNNNSNNHNPDNKESTTTDDALHPKTSKSADQLHGNESEVVNNNNKNKKGVPSSPSKKRNNPSEEVSRKSRKLLQRDDVNEEDLNGGDSSEVYVGCVHLLCSRFKKRKSLSLGNLEKKSNCFPL